MGKGGGAKQQVTEYYMSMHFGVCHAADAITKIEIGDKVAWSGRHEGAGYIDINQPELFGGVKKEGGVVGRVYVLPGGPTQVLQNELAGRMGLVANDCPAYRGLYTLFFVGSASPVTSGSIYTTRRGAGFYWTANSPFIQPVKVTVERKPIGLNPALAIFPDGSVNPAHMIYECLTDTDYGMGSPLYQMNTPMFEAAAQTLWDEQFGLAMIWTRQTEIEKFVGEILDHIQATVYVNPANGLFEVKLLRDDFVFGELAELTVDNCNFTSFQRKMWGETANEVSVTWTNPENEEEETVTHHDLANIVNQGSIIADSRNYYGVRNAELAARLAARDSRTSAAPLAMVECEALREEWDILPGDLRRVTWAEKSLFNVVMRVMKVRNGPKGSGKIALSLLEDVFSLSRPSAYGAAPGGPVSGETPTPITAAKVITLPAFLVNQEIDRVNADAIAYPEVLSGVLAYQAGLDSLNFELLAELPALNGTIQWQGVGTRSLVGRAVTASILAAEPVTAMDGNPLVGAGRGPQIGSFAVIGTGGDYEMEFASIRDFVGGQWILDRGVLDTIPRQWPVGTSVWFLPIGANISDPQYRSDGETVEYKILPRTSLGLLDQGLAPINSATLSGRPHLPLRPANIKINGTGFGEVNATGAPSLIVTWSNRNRQFEDGQVVRWTEANVTPEYLQETIISVFREAGTLLFEVRGLWEAGTYTIPLAHVEQETDLFIRVSSIREGLRSLQSYGLWVRNLPVVASPAAPPASPIIVGPAPPPPDLTVDPITQDLPPPSEPPEPGTGGGGWNNPQL